MYDAAYLLQVEVAQGARKGDRRCSPLVDNRIGLWWRRPVRKVVAWLWDVAEDGWYECKT